MARTEMAGSIASNPLASPQQSGTAVVPPQALNAGSNIGSNAPSRPKGVSNGNEQPASQQQLLHDPGIAVDWSVEEQSILDDGIAKYAPETNSLSKYIKIANLLPDKTVRDVAMRCRWMTKKENGKRRKAEEQNGSKKLKDKRDKADVLTKQVPHGRTTILYTPPPPVDNDDGISYDVGGPTGQLLEQNSQVIAQIRANLAACKLQENTDLLVKFRDNIFAILDGMTIMPGIMSQMPPLPVKLNTDLADTFLPKPMLQASSPSH